MLFGLLIEAAALMEEETLLASDTLMLPTPTLWDAPLLLFVLELFVRVVFLFSRRTQAKRGFNAAFASLETDMDLEPAVPVMCGMLVSAKVLM